MTEKYQNDPNTVDVAVNSIELGFKVTGRLVSTTTHDCFHLLFQSTFSSKIMDSPEPLFGCGFNDQNE